MALIDSVPTTKVELPSIVAGHTNGKLPASLLRNFDGRGSLLVVVSYGMQALHLAAWADDVEGFGPLDTETTGRYRTYERQVQVLKERADPGPTQIPGRPWYRFWNGQWWSGRHGTAQVAVPGTSNHGWAAADDVAEENDGTPGVDSMSDRQLAWMRDNAPSFGFGLETRKERWHWHWIAGDVLPDRAIAVLRYCGIPIPADLAPSDPTPEPPPIPPEDDMARLAKIRVRGRAKQFALIPLAAETNRELDIEADSPVVLDLPGPVIAELEAKLGFGLTPTVSGQ